MYPDPPYFLFLAGFLAAIASGSAFSRTLQDAVKDWAANRSTRTLANLRGIQLKVPYLGICLGICLFLGSGLEIFGFPTQLAYAVGTPLTLFTAGLVWWQLGRNLNMLQEGGSRALDLDAF